MLLSSFLVLSLECSTFVLALPQIREASFRRIRSPKTLEQDPVVIERLKVHSTILYRYATTTVSSTVHNTQNVPSHAKFSVLLPETAFITGFTLEVGGKVYNSFVKERQKAHHLYQNAVENGLTAGHLAVSARDSSHFLISVSLEARGRATFNLTYEELLSRKLGLYNHVVNLHPGQIVPDLSVSVHISESHHLTKLAVLPFHTGGKILVDNNETVWDQVSVEKLGKKKVNIRFSPSQDLQSLLEVVKGEGLAGQLVIRYDVDNRSPGGTILVNEGYFVHFVAPSDLPPLRKHVIFTLDVSGSMTGRKLQQLKEAMTQILDDLDPTDSFNIIEFSYAVTVWNLDSLSSSAVIQPELHSSGLWWYNKAELPPTPSPSPTPPSPPLAVPPYPATEEYIRKAKDVVEKMTAGGGTNIHGALKTAMLVAGSSFIDTSANDTMANPEPIVIFLTDGDPTIGITDPNKILNMVKELNMKQSAIFSLSFGDGADLSFLRRLSLSNNGFARNIYEASDAALQLQNFYKEVASPLLANVTFSYIPGQVVKSTLTSQHFHTLFLGSQLVVAGKLDKTNRLSGSITGLSTNGSTDFTAQTLTEPIDELSANLYGHRESVEDNEDENKEKKRKKKKKKGTLERLWAFLTIQQLLEKKQVSDSEDVKKKVLELALKYNFVTPVTSLVVVKPNQSVEIDQDSLKPQNMKNRIYTGLLLQNKRPTPTKFQNEETSSFMDETTTNKLIQLEAWRKKNLTLEDLRWLDGLIDRENGTVTLPLGVNGTYQQYRLGLDQEDWPMGECTNPVAGFSHCRHLPHCVLPDIVYSVASYIRYYCPLPNGYAGICCPDNKFTTTTERVETTTGDTVATTIEITTEV
ncbi:inter-alpha-trypsin inhibitor heavy chain H4-like [Macrosteles quadrilineatus]|uniref:inter-alpha-trypsin inhibitor heavy chain H4-like n=1 Tax=Macrosteles quadrilineatus TaxID=74068 RepID=UPI0023E1FFFA|nr:inter-alpha-trypsin inhibitor heavy chain H4-like [Macrosteles quadrilineatus]